MCAHISFSFSFLVSAAGASLAQSASVDPSGSPIEVVGPSYRLADFDGDGLEDVYLVHPAGADALFRNLGDGSFEDVTALHGLEGITGSRTALWLDFDQDGALDLYVAHAAGQSRLFQNTIGGYFVDVTAAAGLAHGGAELGAEALDYDGDRLPDLYLATEHGDVLFHNLGQGSFERANLPAGGVRAVEIARGSGPVAHAPDAPAEGTEGPAFTAPGSPRAPGSPDRVALGHAFPSPTPGSAVPGEESAFPSPFVIGNTCTQKIVDQVTGLCTIRASSVPTLGWLYPLSTGFNINPSGNVGIGTTAQTGKLDVVGGMHVDYGNANTGSTVNALRFGDSTTAEAIGSKRNAGGNQNGLDFYTFGINRMAITNGGLVGVNTTTPEGRLHVVSSSAGTVTANTSSSLVLERSPENYLSILSPDASERGILFGEPSSNVAGGIMYNNAATLDGLQFRTNGNVTRMVVTGAGNVGVGTTAPTNQLHVSSTQQIPFRVESNHTGGTWLELDNTSTNADKWHLISTGSTNGEGPGKLLVRDATTGVLSTTFDTNGNVGIGRQPATNRLEVEGNASKSSAGDWLANSDRRIKREIETLEGALDVIDRVRPVAFRYKEEYLAEHPIEDKVYFNVIAQEFAEVFPDYVQPSGEGDILQVDTYPMQVYAIAAIQELHRKLDEKDEQIAELAALERQKDDEIAALGARLSQMERALAGFAAGERVQR